MDLIDLDYSIRASGPLFDGRATMLMRRYTKDVENETAQFANQVVHRNLGQSLRNPTGHYESMVQVRNVDGHAAVTDGNVVYGPWLEGVGSQNFPQTRFRGYASFRRAQQTVSLHSTRIADRVWTERYAGLF